MTDALRELGSRVTRAASGLGLALGLLVAGCAPGDDAGNEGSVIFRFDPPVPEVGTAQLEVRLVDAAGDPLPGAQVELEANMTHAGMVPTFATLAESATQPGVYTGDVEFTMGGDWFLLLEAELADGRSLERTLDVPGVRAP